MRANFLNVLSFIFSLNRINIIARSVKTTFGFGSSRRGDKGSRALYRGAGVKHNRDESVRNEPIRDEPIRDEPIGDESIRDDPIGDEPSGARDDTVTSQVTKSKLCRFTVLGTVKKFGQRIYKMM